jgi:hypothetical protein
MQSKLKLINNYIEQGDVINAQKIFSSIIYNLPKNNVLAEAYILKAYEISDNVGAFRGLPIAQIKAHSLLMRQLSIEAMEEFNRGISKIK